jgi:hypothetical protein
MHSLAHGNQRLLVFGIATTMFFVPFCYGDVELVVNSSEKSGVSRIGVRLKTNAVLAQVDD